ncbi:MAG: hypothetical protein ACO1Q7_10985 [Gemmatimonas sp.]
MIVAGMCGRGRRVLSVRQVRRIVWGYFQHGFMIRRAMLGAREIRTQNIQVQRERGEEHACDAAEDHNTETNGFPARRGWGPIRVMQF